MKTGTSFIQDNNLNITFTISNDRERIELEFNRLVQKRKYFPKEFETTRRLTTLFSEYSLNIQISQLQHERSNASQMGRLGSDKNRTTFQNEAANYHRLVTLLTDLRDTLKSDYGMS